MHQEILKTKSDLTVRFMADRIAYDAFVAWWQAYLADADSIGYERHGFLPHVVQMGLDSDVSDLPVRNK